VASKICRNDIGSEFRVRAPKIPKYDFDSVCLSYENDRPRISSNSKQKSKIFWRQGSRYSSKNVTRENVRIKPPSSTVEVKNKKIQNFMLLAYRMILAFLFPPPRSMETAGAISRKFSFIFFWSCLSA
jgi:hypothetical protein